MVATLTETVSLVVPTATVIPPPTVTPEPTEPPPSNGTEDSQEPPADESTDEDDTEETTPETAASEADECPSNPTRIQAGSFVRVLDWLNFRAAPGIGKTILHTNKPGTEMEVIGGPICTPHTENPPRAYLWWNVRMEDGREGWSAEAPLNFPNYFLAPVE
ncbi:MAG TPA: SH3 domain-containing protein [Anaerolineales bacterium]|nr:SH3 domain-containing protein [Anaerolineales bacterium]